MRLPLTIIAVAINIIVFMPLTAFLMTQINEQKMPTLSTFFFAVMELGLILNTILICTARQIKRLEEDINNEIFRSI